MSRNLTDDTEITGLKRQIGESWAWRVLFGTAAPPPKRRHAAAVGRQVSAGGELCHRHGGDTPPCVGHCSMQIRKEAPGLAHVTATRPGAARVMPRQNVEQGVAL